MEVLKTSDEFLTGLMEIELQDGRSIDQLVKVNWPPADGTQTDAQSPVHAHMFTQLIFRLTRHRLLSGNVVV